MNRATRLVLRRTSTLLSASAARPASSSTSAMTSNSHLNQIRGILTKSLSSLINQREVRWLVLEPRVSSRRSKSKSSKAEERSLEGSAKFVRSTHVILGKVFAWIFGIFVVVVGILWVQSKVYARHIFDDFSIAEAIEPSLADHVLLDRKIKGYLESPSRGLVLTSYEIQMFLALYDDYFGINGKIVVTNERDGFISLIASLPRFGDTFLNVKLYLNILKDPESNKWAIVLDDAEFVRFALNVNNDAFEQLTPSEEIVGEIDEFNVPQVLKDIARVTNSVEIRHAELFLNCQHPLTEEGIEPARVVTTKPWDHFKPTADEQVVSDT